MRSQHTVDVNRQKEQMIKLGTPDIGILSPYFKQLNLYIQRDLF